MAREVGIRELKARTSAVLREVYEDGHGLIITVHGRAVARIEPISPPVEQATVDGMGNTRGAFGEMPALEWEDFEVAKRVWEPRPLGDG